ncbi:RNA-dependent RNA polymerase 1 [Hordeum vulgare]|nr:RNA-dependent RNA polymerase 1 [Hordeum vulgare]
MEELTDDDKVEEMLDDLSVKGEKVVNIIVIRSNAPRPSDLNIGHVCEDQVPLSEIDGDIIARLEAMKKHRDDPLHDTEGDTEVDEPYEADEEEEEAAEEENAPEEEEERAK